MSKSKVANKVTGLQEFLDSLSKPEMKNGAKLRDLSGDGKITRKDVLIGRGVLPKPKGQKGMNVMNEAKKNATRTITDGYYAMGGKKEMNPLRSIVKKNKMQMGGPFFSMKPSTPMIGTQKNFENKESFKKGGMTKKKK